jgi:superfamily II DNA or RNA helicase
LASYGIFSTGRNIKNLSNIVFASPYKSKIKVLQSIGRGLRLHHEKDVCRIYDFVDDCRQRTKTGKVKRNNFLFTHFLKRHELYQQENFKTTVVNL